MAYPVYSERFLTATVSGLWSVYTVPAGARAVIKCLTGSNGNATAGILQVAIAGTNVFYDSIPGHQSQTFTGLHLVVYGGEQMMIWPDIAGMHASLSGFLFLDTDMAGEPGKELVREPVPLRHREIASPQSELEV